MLTLCAVQNIFWTKGVLYEDLLSIANESKISNIQHSVIRQWSYAYAWPVALEPIFGLGSCPLLIL